jgi:hypothetical protein
MIATNCIIDTYPELKNASFDQAASIFSSYGTLKSNRELNEIVFDNLGIETDENHARSIINYITTQKYPNESVIKSAFINSVLFKTKNHVTIFELNANNCRVDLCKINGESIAYEIKTDLDNLDRLKKQLSEYLLVFEKVYVICSIDRVEEVSKTIHTCVGIYTYKLNRYGAYSFCKKKEAIKSNSINPEKQLHMLTQQERKEQKLTDNCNPQKINAIFKKALKKRYNDQWIFLNNHKSDIYDIDYQWFFKNQIKPSIIYEY